MQIGESKRTGNEFSRRGGLAPWLVAASVIVLGLVVLTTLEDGSNDAEEQQDVSAQNYETNLISEQRRCLDEASERYNANWKAADKDGDGKLAYADGSTNITTTYFDDQISCHRIWKTSDSDGYITDLQAKRQQEVDTYNAWLGALSNATTSQNSPISCTTNTIGSYTYTNCY